MLYIGGLSKGTTGYRKYLAFKSEIDDVAVLDTDTYKRGSGLVTFLNHKRILSNKIQQLNNSIQDFIKGKSFDLVYVSKGDWIFPETVAQLSSKSLLLVHYTPDAAFRFNYSKLFSDSVHLYDFLLTTKEWELEEYYRYTSKEKILLVHQGVDLSFFKPASVYQKTEDVMFIGRKENHYKDVLDFVFEQGFPLSVYGKQWLRQGLFHKQERYVKGGNLIDGQYTSMINNSKICLGLLSKLFPETTTTRTFEITSCGTFFLGERTERHQELFEENKEAVFFSEKEELASKLKFYLANERQRELIAAAGRRRCVQSGYSNVDMVRMIVGLLKTRQ